MQFFEAIFKMFGKAVFEVIEVKEAAWSRSGILRLKIPNKCIKKSNIQVCFYVGYFSTRNESKSTIATKKSEKVWLYYFLSVRHCETHCGFITDTSPRDLCFMTLLPFVDNTCQETRMKRISFCRPFTVPTMYYIPLCCNSIYSLSLVKVQVF